MQAAIEQFRANLSYVRNLSAVHVAARTFSPGLDTSDVLRAQIVLVVSALDHYIHELTRLGILEVFNGKRPRTSAFDRTRVTLDGVLGGLKNPAVDDWLNDQIRRDHSWQSFQTAENIADAIRLFSNVVLWDQVGQELGVDPQILKGQLKLTIDRRNKIAHEADLDPSFPGARWPIDDAMAKGAIDFVEQVCEAIQRVVL
jgi:hypothetical protein